MEREWLGLAQWRVGEFTEALHPRDPSGKFGSGSAGGAAKPAQAPAKQGFQKAKTPAKKDTFGKAKLEKGFSKGKTKSKFGKSQTHLAHTKEQKRPTGKKKPAGLTPDDKATIKTLADLIAIVSEQMTGLANSGNKKAAMQLAQVIAAAKNRITKIQNKAEQ